ncbi:MAG: hypothetical protein KKD28_14460 [Chloroflexi bacterium]|nr:hypothetical protein [Chloroflexota bacterium]MBU1662662.1 hypothetical protein [Chloroflexota bacterium]
MFRRFSINFAILSIILDTLLISLALASANLLRPWLSVLPFARDIYKPTVPPQLYLLLIITWVAILLLLSVYDGRRNIYVVNELTSITIGSILAGVSLAGILYLSYRDVSRLLFVVFVFLAYLMLVTWRLLARLIFHLGNGNFQPLRQVLIAGAGPVGENLQAQILQRPHLGLTITGFLDDDPAKCNLNAAILGSLKSVRRVVTTK